MRDIYLIDFENVASEGLSGITYLSEDDQVIIFYSNNSNRLTMKMHILIGKSVCNLTYFEVTVGGKNALDHQISTFLGYLIGTEAAERNYYIVSRDMGYRHVANFWTAKQIGPKVRCIDAIKGASRLERNRREPVLQPVSQEDVPEVQEQTAPPEAQVDSPIAEIPQEAVAAAAPPAEAPVAPPEQEVTVSLPVAETPESTPVLPEDQEPEEAGDEIPSEPVNPEPELQTKPQEPIQRRINRNRPRSRGRYRKNSPTAPQAPAQESPAQDTMASAEPLPEEKPEEKPQPAEKKPEQKKKPQNPKASKQEPVNLEQLSSLIAPYPKLQENVLRDLIVTNKRQVLCNTLRKHLGQEKGLALYNEIKKCVWH